MAVLLRWTVPESSEIGYDMTHIERGTSSSGPFSEITTQAISDNTYVDETGTTSNYYRIRFKNTATGEYSGYSDVMQGGVFAGYCSLADIRAMTNLTTTDISDTDLFELMSRATAQVNSDINVHVERELISPLDNTRENKIDGSNTTYYVRNWFGKYIADRNHDGDITTDDIIVYQVDTDGTETTLTVSSITDNEGKFVLSSAPSSGVRLYVTYDYSYVREKEGNIDARLRNACIFLTASYAYSKVNRGCAPAINFGSQKITRDMTADQYYYEKYLNIISQIQSLGGVVNSTENVWSI